MAMVRERIGHTDHSYHHVLWYDNLLIKYLHKKGMFLRVKEGGGGGGRESSIVPFKVGGALVDSLHVARTASACGQSTV